VDCNSCEGRRIVEKPNEHSIGMEQPDKKHIIFQTVLELIREKGFHGTPVSMIAERANVAAGTIYHYFDSKEVMLIELYKYIKDQVQAIVAKTEQSSRTYPEQFYQLWIALYQFYINNPNVLGFFEQFVNSPYYTDELSDNTCALRKTLLDFVSKGVKQNVLMPLRPEILSALFHGNIITMAKMHKLRKVVLKKEEVSEVIDACWRSVTKPGTGYPDKRTIDFKLNKNGK
jgi:AcrR family transcriptional regulator